MRTAAGHIHIGWGEDFDPQDDEHFSRCCRLVQQLDAGIGLASVLLDNDTERRQLYGAAGAFRPKPYGVEYRVLSNFWVLNPSYREFVWNRVKESCRYIMVDKEFIPSKFPHIDFQKAIDSGDKKVAETFESYKLFNDIPFPSVK